jgi:hypothetical protein
MVHRLLHMNTTLGALLLVGGCLSGLYSTGCGSTTRGSDGTKEATAGPGNGGSPAPSASNDPPSAGSPAEGSSRAAAIACDEYATAECHKIAMCNPWFIASYFEDEAACQKRFANAGGCVAGFALRGTSRTLAWLKACTSAMNASTCTEWLDDDPGALAPCTVKPGSLSNGTGCADDAQCQSGHCRRSDDCGVCGPAPSSGESCSDRDKCAPGLSCNNFVCGRAKEAGDACESNADCPNSLTCNEGHCASPKSAGQVCRDDSCDGHAGLSCADGVCRATQHAAWGQPCNLSNGIDCAAGGFCHSAGSSAQGTCVAPADDGESCDDQLGPGCLPLATCTGGYCKVADLAACH